MQIKAEALAAHLAKGLKAVYVVHGDEPLLAQEAADALRTADGTPFEFARVVDDLVHHLHEARVERHVEALGAVGPHPVVEAGHRLDRRVEVRDRAVRRDGDALDRAPAESVADEAAVLTALCGVAAIGIKFWQVTHKTSKKLDVVVETLNNVDGTPTSVVPFIHFALSKSPDSVRGVWHSWQRATSSTMYLPRASAASIRASDRSLPSSARQSYTPGPTAWPVVLSLKA